MTVNARMFVSACKCISIYLCIFVYVVHKSSDTVRQNASIAAVSLVASREAELWKQITMNLNACGMQQRFRNQHRN
jgi:signal transduction histidine kinase